MTDRSAEGIPSNPPHHKRKLLTSHQTENIRERYDDGETAISLAAEHGVSTATIRRYINPRK